MYIKEVEIDNFKSFANTVTIPFLKGFTTISGPNGSGKSNIIDSILLRSDYRPQERFAPKKSTSLSLPTQEETKLT